MFTPCAKFLYSPSLQLHRPAEPLARRHLRDEGRGVAEEDWAKAVEHVVVFIAVQLPEPRLRQRTVTRV